MQEEYLHLVWKLKRLPLHQLQLTNGTDIQIVDVGIHNHYAGPDFFNGKIIIEGITWVGNIEFHVHASDWYKHHHHHDPAYNNTILHVVYDYDQDIIVEGRILPTLELKNYLDFNHWKKYRSLMVQQNWIPCQSQVSQVAEEVKQKQIEISVIQRLKNKTAQYSQQIDFYQGDLLSLYYILYAKTFGLKVNELPFLELVAKVHYSILWRSTAEESRIILFGVAGFFQATEKFKLKDDEKKWNFLKQKYDLHEMQLHSWKFKGIRPVSFPQYRIAEFGEFCRKQSFFRLHELEPKQILELINQHFPKSGILKKSIVINAIVPLLWWYAETHNQPNLRENAIELLLATQGETNSIMDNWKKIGFNIKSSFDSQGLLELKNEFCKNKKCLTCKIGFELLKA